MFGTTRSLLGIKEDPSEELEIKEESLDISCKMSEPEASPSIEKASRMRGIYCKICSKIYSERNPPLILLCGHSCCTSCLAQIIDNNKICHVCKRGLMHLNVSHYPINYTVLEISEQCSSVDNLRKRIESVNKVHEKILYVAESSVSKVMTNKDKVEAMKLNVPKLQDLIATDDDILNVKMADVALDDIERLMKEVAEIFSFNNKIDLMGKINKVGVRFHLHSSQFKTSKEFLTKIYNEIINGTQIVAHKVIDGVDSFAKVSVDGSLILLHAFRSSPKNGEVETFPQDGHFTSFPKEGQAKVIEFKDFKNVSRWMKLRAFIDDNVGKRLFIDLVSQSVRSYFFLQLCTGEKGTSYLNKHIKLGYITKVYINHNGAMLNWKDRYLEYLSKEDTSYFNCVSKKTYAEFTLDGSIHIRNDLCGNTRNICGLVVNPETRHANFVFKSGANNVPDCGIGHFF